MFRHVLIKCSQNNNKLNSVLCKYNNQNVNKSCRIVPNYIISKNIHSACLDCNHHHAPKEKAFRQENVHALNEKEFLVKLQNDPDVFGGTGHSELPLEEGDLEEEEYLTEKPMGFRKLSTKQYADIIKSFLRKRKIKEAIDVVEVRMLKEDKVKPENYLYNLLIGACGRVGYTKKAFSLYNEMKRRALDVTPGTYTALFNACANSPWPTTDGLTRARHLRNIMLEKMYEPNVTNYNAMIKAFGRCGDLEMAFALVDEMIAKKFAIKDDTLNFLLQACITDKDAGFRHALLVWHKFVQKRIRPSVYSYNLMLRCIRDCSLGDIETTNDVIDKLLSSSGDKTLLLANEAEQKVHIADDGDQKSMEIVSNKPTEIDENVLITRPNLMAKVPHLGNVLSISEVTKPEDRLLLVGGCSGFLENMANNNCTPDIKTFTQLVDNIPGTLAAEKELLRALRKNNIKPDVDFFNTLIKKRSIRLDYGNAKEVLTMIETARLKPNLITYGVLALGCKSKEEAISLLDEMKAAKYRINVEILGAMLRIACHHNNFPYVIHILEMCHTEDVKPSQKFMEILDMFKKKTKRISNNSSDPLSKSNEFQKGYKIFKMRYKTWLGEIEVDNSDNVHPWQQYRQNSDTDVRHYTDKQEKSHFKPVHTNLFRQKSKVQNVKVKK